MKIFEKRRLEEETGFTLIELMVVIVILGILATFVAPRLLGRTEDAKRSAAKVQIASFESALKLYKLDNGDYPSTEQGLEALVEKPATGTTPPHWKEGGYLEKGKVPADPWGNEYVYLSPGIHNNDYDIASYAKDSEEGGSGNDEDIESWSLD